MSGLSWEDWKQEFFDVYIKYRNLKIRFAKIFLFKDDENSGEFMDPNNLSRKKRS